MVTLDQRIRTLEDENRTLTMSKSQCSHHGLLFHPLVLQNKHILEQQLDEVVKESSTMKTEMTRLQLQLQVIVIIWIVMDRESSRWPKISNIRSYNN